MTNEEIITKRKEKHFEIEGDYLPICETCTKQMLNQARADSLRFAITHMRCRCKICLKDRAILLNEINWLEREVKELEA